MTEDRLPRLRDVLAEHGISPRKSLGQNFIFDLNLTRRIAREANVAGSCVYEVGPGPGGLTRALLSEGASGVVAVERDRRAIPALRQVAEAWPELHIVEADALAVDEPAILHDTHISPPVAVVANLPFNTGTALLTKWLTIDWPPWWSSLTLMFQKEVAERVCAQPQTGAYGRLSVLAQWRCTARILFQVSRQAFVPPPKVTAAVLRIDPLPAPRFPAEIHDLEKVTAAAFGQRRKMLRSSLKSLNANSEAMLETAGISPSVRAEELDVAQFCALARAYAGLRGTMA